MQKFRAMEPFYRLPKNGEPPAQWRAVLLCNLFTCVEIHRANEDIGLSEQLR